MTRMHIDLTFILGVMRIIRRHVVNTSPAGAVRSDVTVRIACDGIRRTDV